MNTRNFECGQTVFKEGDYSNCMYIIAQGKVEILGGYGTKDEKQIAVLGEGEVFGEMGLIECYPRSATAIVMEDGTVLEEISEEEISDFFKDKPDQLLKLMKQLSARIRETTKNYADACRVIYENTEAEKGTVKSDWLTSHESAIVKFFKSLHR